MPDIQSALQAALSRTADAWASDEEAHKQIQPPQEKAMTATTEKPDARITNNISRTLFDLIRANPGSNRTWVADQLVAQGFKYVSITSLISQMVRARMAVLDEKGGLTATLREYEPIRPHRKPVPRKKAVAHQRTDKTRDTAPKAVYTKDIYQPAPAPVPEPTQHMTTALYTTPADWTVESVIEGLSVRQAMAVYMELRKIFGA
jgi:hypothetical protein